MNLLQEVEKKNTYKIAPTSPRSQWVENTNFVKSSHLPSLQVL